MAQTKNGKQVLNLADKEKAQAFAVVPEGADSIAALSEGRKLLIFPLEQVPEMGRGRGVTAAEVQGRPAVGRAGLPARRRPAVGQPRHPGQRAEVLARRARPGRAACPKRAGRAPSASRTDRMDLDADLEDGADRPRRGPHRVPAGLLDRPHHPRRGGAALPGTARQGLRDRDPARRDPRRVRALPRQDLRPRSAAWCGASRCRMRFADGGHRRLPAGRCRSASPRTSTSRRCSTVRWSWPSR